MYVSILPPLSLADMHRKSTCELADLFPGAQRFYAQGRQAIGAGIDLLGITQEDEILMPASMCAEVLNVFAARGIGICYYQLDEKLEPDFKDIESKINERTKLLYVNHYFGFATPLAKLKALCDERSLYMLEDCALTLGSPLGHTGDIAIFSPWKFFPTPEGGVLSVNNPKLTPPKELPPRKAPKLGEALRKAFHSLAFYNLLPFQTLKKISGRVDNAPHWQDEIDVSKLGTHPISQTSLSIIKHTDITRIKDKRRAHYKFWKEQGIPCLYQDLPAQDTPFAYPMLCENKTSRDKLYAALVKRGIYVEPSINYPYMCLSVVTNKGETFETINDLGDRILSLPVHQALLPRHFKAILGCINHAN